MVKSIEKEQKMTRDLDQKKLAINLINLYEKMQAQRRPLEKIWQEIDHFVRPSRVSNSINTYASRDIYDSTAILSAEYLISGLWSLINSSALKWFEISAKDKKLMANVQVKEWFKEVNFKMQQTLGDSSCGFYHKSYEFYGDLVAFGSAVFSLTEDLETQKPVFQSYPLSDILFSKSYNNIDTVIRKINFTAKQAIDFFGIDKVSQNIQKASAEESEEKFLFLHITLPIRYFNSQCAVLKNMKYACYYVDIQAQQIVKQSGYYEFPYMIARWQTNSNQVYGQSPAMVALADIKMLNMMSKTMIIAAQKQVDPTILAPNESSVQGIKTTPGGVIYGGIDPLTGNQLIKPLHVASDMSNSYHLQEQRRNSVKEAFYHSLLMFTYSNNATATEVLSINEQKLRILGAKISRIQSEFLYPLLKRYYNIMLRLGLFKKPPMDIEDIEINFCGTWDNHQKINDTSSINQLISLIKNIQPLQADIASNVNWVETLKIFADRVGISENLFKSNN